MPEGEIIMVKYEIQRQTKDGWRQVATLTSEVNDPQAAMREVIDRVIPAIAKATVGACPQDYRAVRV